MVAEEAACPGRLKREKAKNRRPPGEDPMAIEYLHNPVRKGSA